MQYICLCVLKVCVVLNWFTSVAVFSGMPGSVLGVGVTEDVLCDMLVVFAWTVVEVVGGVFCIELESTVCAVL